MRSHAINLELATNPALVDAILARPDILPPVRLQPERVIRCSRENAERAICRALARAQRSGELWRVEVVEKR